MGLDWEAGLSTSKSSMIGRWIFADEGDYYHTGEIIDAIGEDCFLVRMTSISCPQFCLFDDVFGT